MKLIRHDKKYHDDSPWKPVGCQLFVSRPYIYILSKEVGKQYFRVTNDFYLVQLTMMKGGRSQNNT